MERKYFSINEEAARQAQAMWSMRDYVSGSKTAEYKRLVDLVYDLADKVAVEKPDKAGDAYSLAERYAKKLAENFNNDSRINLMCPSIMIAGPANFPVKKKERQNRAAEKNNQEYMEIQKYAERIKAILYGREVILSDDDNALGKLQEKLESLQAMQEKMKAVNAYYRKQGTLDGCDLLTPDEVLKLKAEMQREWHREKKPYLSWQLSNNNQNIHAVKERIERLAAVKATDTESYDTEHFKVVENKELMRLQLFFDGKPDEEIRTVVKGNGFRWAPSNQCWQRQLTTNAKYALKTVIRELDELRKKREG